MIKRSFEKILLPVYKLHIFSYHKYKSNHSRCRFMNENSIFIIAQADKSYRRMKVHIYERFHEIRKFS